MAEIDQWVVRNTLAWLGDIHRIGLDTPLVCAINLSGESLGNESFLDNIQSLLSHYQVPGESVCFEITETSTVSNFDAARHFIQVLTEEGCHFSLDDFGSGISSFDYLRNLPVHFLKIDGSFVRDILANPLDEAMVRSMHSIGQAMGLKTIAEFVEDAETIDRLASIGVDYVQGFHIDRPRPLEQLDSVRCMPR